MKKKQQENIYQIKIKQDPVEKQFQKVHLSEKKSMTSRFGDSWEEGFARFIPSDPLMERRQQKGKRERERGKNKKTKKRRERKRLDQVLSKHLGPLPASVVLRPRKEV